MSRDLVSILRERNIALPPVVAREPETLVSDRWVRHIVDKNEYQFIQPITFTPYASVKPCSARCQFCSENLRQKDAVQHASLLRPSRYYFDQLEAALYQLRGLQLSYSLSGLEMTDDVSWFCTLLECLSAHRDASSVEQSILYSNGAGFSATKSSALLMQKISDFDFNWLEISRHHFDDSVNQGIMRFRPEYDIRTNSVFSSVLKQLIDIVPVKLVCIVQVGGVDSAQSLLRYLRWANSMGVQKVIFREFSLLGEQYRENTTYNYIASTRQAVSKLLVECLQDPYVANTIDWLHVTQGYYFQNLVGNFAGTEVTFEYSDYSKMHAKHDSGRIYKLVFHGNGNLCAGWEPDKHVLYPALGRGDRGGK